MGNLRLRTRLIWGGEALGALGELKGLKILVVSDHFLAQNGLVNEVLSALEGSEVTVFDGVTGEPTLEMVAGGVAALGRARAQAVVAFGGGSAMDCAKGIVWYGEGRLPLWCIPTTAGTGSEVTAFSVLTDAKNGVKFPLVDDALVPDVALLDGRFLAGVPRSVTADTGMDVLTHATEAYVAVRANPLTDALAEKAFVTAYARLPAACAGDRDAKEDMLFASAMAGLAFNGAGLGACHALAHALGARIHAPHGRVNAALLAHVIEANAQDPATAKKYAKLAGLCGLSPNHRALSGALRRLCRRLGVPERLTGSADLAQVAADAEKDPCMADNVKTFTPAQLQAILREVTA